MEYKYTGIILNKYDIGETDRIYTIYTFEGGKIRSLAKGVRKSQAKLASSLESITLSDITIVKSRGLGKITGSIVENNFTKIKSNCEALTEVFFALNIFEKLVNFENPDTKVFILLKNYLETVDFCVENKLNEKQILVRLGFTVKLLDALGYTIEVNTCVSCGEKMSENFLCFSSQYGGALCESCGTINNTCAFKIHTNTVKLLRLFLKNKIHSLIKIKTTIKDCNSVSLAINDFLQWTL